MTRNNTLKIYIEHRTSEDEYVFDFILRSLDLNGEIVNSPKGADIRYFSEKPESSDTERSLDIIRDPSHIIWHDLLENKIDLSTITNYLPFDIVHAISYLLTDKGNRGSDSSCYDEHQRLKYMNSYQYKNGIGAIPLVNRYILVLKEIFEKRSAIPLGPKYPKEFEACIILSHDVDIPSKHDGLMNYSIFPDRSSNKTIWAHYRHFFGQLKDYLLDTNKSEFWCFDQIFDAEIQHGFRSTSYFAVVNSYHDHGSRLDVSYSANSSKFKKVFSRMKKEGFEIGLHASYNAFRGRSRFEYEKKTLEQISNTEIIGLRHHYWHLGEDPFSTLYIHQLAGFKYDSSFAFNDHIGFRNSCALPFFPYHSNSEHKINVLQIPTFCMDGHLFNDPNITVDTATNTISNFLDIIIDHKGVGAIDWHIRTSYPKGSTYEKWGQTYLAVLKELARRKNVWVTTAADFYRWWTKTTANSGLNISVTPNSIDS